MFNTMHISAYILAGTLQQGWHNLFILMLNMFSEHVDVSENRKRAEGFFIDRAELRSSWVLELNL